MKIIDKEISFQYENIFLLFNDEDKNEIHELEYDRLHIRFYFLFYFLRIRYNYHY